MATDIREHTVPSSLDGARLDKAAVVLESGTSRAKVKRAIDMGAVRVNGRRSPKGAVVATGDRITIDVAQLESADAPALPTPEAPLVVRFESSSVLVVDKPAGQPSAPLRAGERGTLANALVDLARARVRLVGTDAVAERTIFTTPLARPIAVVLGSEREGLLPIHRTRCDMIVSIPGAGRMDSLNVSVAAGIVLAELARSAGRAP